MFMLSLRTSVPIADSVCRELDINIQCPIGLAVPYTSKPCPSCLVNGETDPFFVSHTDFNPIHVTIVHAVGLGYGVWL